jgi:hypothetical protein
MRRLILSTLSLSFVMGLTMAPGRAGEPLPQATPVDPRKGNVIESGKFEAKADAALSAPAPDPATRLAELGITADQEKVRIGIVEFDRKTQTVSIPATVNLLEGAVEYFLVHENGKTHESIFSTRAKPDDIHIACLLAGWKPAEKPAEIDVRVTWETNGPPRSLPAAELVAIADGHPNARDGRHIEDGPWQYTGSRLDAAGFAAAREGSIIALITDPAALVANPRPGRLDDTLHAPNRAQLPPKDHPVRILLRRVEPDKKQPKG